MADPTPLATILEKVSKNAAGTHRPAAEMKLLTDGITNLSEGGRELFYQMQTTDLNNADKKKELMTALSKAPEETRVALADFTKNMWDKNVQGFNGFDGYNVVPPAANDHYANPGERSLPDNKQKEVDDFLAKLSPEAKKAVELMNDVRMNSMQYKAPAREMNNGESDQQYSQYEMGNLQKVEKDPETIKLGQEALATLSQQTRDELHNARLELEKKGLKEVIWEPSSGVQPQTHLTQVPITDSLPGKPR